MDLGALLLTMALARGADTGSSLAVFAQGGTEANPLVLSQRPGLFVAQMATETVGQIVLCRWLEKKGHPRWAKAIAMVQIGASSAATANNVREWNKGRSYGR